ncbi:unnamed protein product [Acanthoscelides obtectus]|uniref:Endonuclease/exonuclease/phosphatase domain-containing protein n=1 Tax=Acanthoscelides obtectus TaxID=200917 RepID=A0A9P0Q921_ACAOB|nr:unnamed protein product [Acanthoscelides obtectus]CAK1620828.1 hypothetical protein AOBTE_LOCUS595 [Acanthoscelides obtectus]
MIDVVTALNSFIFNNNSFSITGIYRPNSTNVQDFVNNLDSYLRSTANCDISLLVGDINIDLFREHEYSNLGYVNMLQQNGYISQINTPTRVDSNSSTIIDHIFLKANRFKVSETAIECKPILLENCMTDHYPVLFNFGYLKGSNCIINKNSYEFKKIDEKKLTDYLQVVTCDSVFSESDVQKATDNFYNELYKGIDHSTYYLKINSKTRKRKPWMTEGILTSIKKRDELKQSLTKDNDNMILRKSYISYRNRVTNFISFFYIHLLIIYLMTISHALNLYIV